MTKQYTTKCDTHALVLINWHCFIFIELTTSALAMLLNWRISIDGNNGWVVSVFNNFIHLQLKFSYYGHYVVPWVLYVWPAFQWQLCRNERVPWRYREWRIRFRARCETEHLVFSTYLWAQKGSWRLEAESIEVLKSKDQQVNNLFDKFNRNISKTFAAQHKNQWRRT